jgi:hypothetical protein
MQKYLLLMLILLGFVGFGGIAYSQDTLKVNDSLAAGAAKVFIQCDVCDFDYLKTEMTFVNFVRDQGEADVYLLITTQSTAAGGKEYTIEITGKKHFSGMIDTLKYFTITSESEDSIRKGLVKNLKLGLMRYVAKTPLAKEVTISYSKPAISTRKIDKWKNWVFTISAQSYFNGEKSYRYLYFYGNVIAKRVTEKNRFQATIYGSRSENNYEYEDFKYTSISKNKGIESEYILGLTDHWSIGLGSELYSSTYSNYQSSLTIYPELEYNIFPYKQSTKRQLRLVYLPIIKYNDYEFETIYNKFSEWYTIQRFMASLKFIQEWGDASTFIQGSFQLPKTSRNRLVVGGDISIRVFKGFSITMNGEYDRIHDQINLVKGDASESDVIAQRRQLATCYSYYGSIGIKYSFGSIFSNIVNPRFGY